MAHVLPSNMITHGNWFQDKETVPPTTSNTPPSPAIAAFLARHGVSQKNPTRSGVVAAMTAGIAEARCVAVQVVNRYGRAMSVMPRIALAVHSLFWGTGRRKDAAITARAVALTAITIAVKRN